MLLVEDNLAEARLLQEFLKGTAVGQFQLVHKKRLQEAIAYLTTDWADVILLDLTLPDSQGLDSLDTLIAQVPSLPIVVLTNTNNDELAVEAVRHGAQDYLFKRLVNQDNLVRSVRYAIERKQASEALREANEALEARVQARTAELAAANQQLMQQAALLDITTDAIVVTTLNYRILFWNKGAETLYGWNRSDALGQSMLDLIHSAETLPIDPLTQHQLLEIGYWQSELQQVTKDQQSVLVQSRWTLVRDEAGQPRSILIVNTDITEKKQLEAQFLQAQRLESLGTLASGIAHDLNNILTPILAIAKLLPLKLPDLSERNQQMIKALESSAQHGTNLVKQILLFAQGGESEWMPLQLEAVLTDLEIIIQQTFPRSIDVHIHRATDLWTVTADATQLHQVLMNLCVNARDAMPNGGTLTISLDNFYSNEEFARKHLDANIGPYVVLTVSDTGVGMSTTTLSRIFDPFFTTKEVGKGTGLGLSAVLGITKSHGGFVAVRSDVGQGSEFQVYLPAIEESGVGNRESGMGD
ncbi:ATP-binding response regulator [Thermocoleostomius sinensis]|uniref:histidine kinase n=1 Tax=Thermocoleostomius sinensis A174 TaxID=2016057 RepID=A0A9E8ZCY0_9CYAN|nr:ATP-binding protein [Thermocoleostomius sinensis]WAL60853.1 ATP-binding protein [Thermocoleostomius sinensis A174]